MSSRGWQAAVEAGLLAIGVVCLAIYAHVTVDARRYREEQLRRLDAVPAVTPAAESGPERPERGMPVGRLEIPRLGLSTPIVEGDDEATLRRAAGHLPDTPLPWENGNSAIAGHRDGVFRPLRRIAVGDTVVVHTPHGRTTYLVTGLRVVEPDDLSVLSPRARPALSLITCHPFTYIGPAPRRFVVQAERAPAEAAPDVPPPPR